MLTLETAFRLLQSAILFLMIGAGIYGFWETFLKD